MPSKRNLPPSLGFERRVRARREDDWEPGAGSGDVSPGSDVSEEAIGGAEASEGERPSAPSDDGSESGRSDSEDASDDDDDGEAAPKFDLSTVSFGALARAQASLPSSSGRRSSKPRPDSSSGQPQADAPREARAAPGGRGAGSAKAAPAKRSSKHAPQEQSSKRPVSRRREILPDVRRKARDPRFDPLVGRGRVDEAKAGKAYAFLDEYRDSEMAELRAQIKKAGSAAAREELKRRLMSMESKKKARQRKADEDLLLREHRAQEKELVAQGKTPYYLKRSEQKKRLLTKRFEGMSKGQVDRAIERKRKKVAGQEKKELDSLLRPKGPRRA